MTQNATLLPVDRAAVVFIEFQGEWLDPDAPLRQRFVRDDQAFEAAIASAARLIGACRGNRQPIVHAGLDLTQDPDYQIFGAGTGLDRSGLRGAIPKAQTWIGERSAFRAPFDPRQGEFISKGRSGASVIKHANLDAYLRNNDIRSIYLCGFATHVCVESTLREAHDLGLDAWVVADCCAAFTTDQHDHVLQHVVHHFGRATESHALIAAMQNNREPEAAASSS